MPIRPQFETEEEWLEHLRSWFAGQALVGLVSQGKDVKLLAPPSGSDNLSEMCAKSAYLVADAMLAERAK